MGKSWIFIGFVIVAMTVTCLFLSAYSGMTGKIASKALQRMKRTERPPVKRIVPDYINYYLGKG